MAGKLADATFILALLSLLLFSGCIQESEAQEAPRGDPPFKYDPLSYMYDEIVQEPSDYEEVFGCEPPEMSNHCEGKTRYYDFECVNGEWEYKVENCTYDCVEGVCIKTGCPPCSDGNPCTTDFCSGAPNYECIHVPIAGCNIDDEAISGKACSPTAGPGSYIRIEVYPAGVPSTYAGDPYMAQTLKPGERMWIDSDDWISLDGFWLEGTCPACFYDPIMKWPPQAKLTASKDLSGSKASYSKDLGEIGYICIDGTCRKSTAAGCTDYVCNTSMRFVVSELDADLVCS